MDKVYMVLIVLVVIAFSACSVRRCYPSKSSSDYAVINNQDKIYH
jgi:hypothetical protein